MYEIYYIMGKGYWWCLKVINGEIFCYFEMFIVK